MPDASDALASEYDLFAECLDLGADAREARLALAPPDLAARVRRLLEVHERSEAGDESASLGGARRLALDVRGGPRIDGALGPYRLQQKLGDGAMGEVFLAVQSEPVRRLVAVKLLRPEVVAQVSRIAAPSVASITLTLNDGRTVVWGTTDRTDEKAEKLAALLTQPGRVYDVSSPDLPTVK